MKKFFNQILSIFKIGESVPKISDGMICIPSFKMEDIVNEAVMPILKKHQSQKAIIVAKEDVLALRDAMQEQGHSSIAQKIDQMIEKGHKLILIETKDDYSAFGLSAEDTSQDEVLYGGVVFSSGECIQYDADGNEQRSLVKIDQTKQAKNESKDQTNLWESIVSLISKIRHWRFTPEEIPVDNFRKLIVCPIVSEALRKNKKWAKAIIMLPEDADSFLDALEQKQPQTVPQIRQYLSDGQKQLVLFMDQEGNATFRFLKAKEPQTPADMLSMVVFPSGEYQNYNTAEED